MKINAYLAAVCALVLSACGGSGGSDATSNTSAASPSAPIAIGAAGSARDLEVTVSSVKTPKQIGPQGAGGNAAAGETYVVVAYTIKNTGKATLPYLEWPKFSLIDPSGRSISSDDMVTAMSATTMDDATGMVSNLNPGVSAKARAAWKVASSFDKKTWKLELASDPQLTFALQ